MTYTITKGKQKIQYNDQNIVKKYRASEEQRKNLLLNIIELNPKIPHTHLIEIALFYGDAKAKRTYENLLNKLENNGIVLSEKTGSSPNSPRLWEISTQESINEKQFQQMFKDSMEKGKKRLDELAQLLPTLSDYQKALLLCILLKSNNENLMTAKFGSNIINMDNQLNHLTKYEKRLHEIMQQYPNCLKYVPVILDSFQLETLKMILQINEGFSK